MFSCYPKNADIAKKYGCSFLINSDTGKAEINPILDFLRKQTKEFLFIWNDEGLLTVEKGEKYHVHSDGILLEHTDINKEETEEDTILYAAHNHPFLPMSVCPSPMDICGALTENIKHNYVTTSNGYYHYEISNSYLNMDSYDLEETLGMINDFFGDQYNSFVFSENTNKKIKEFYKEFDDEFSIFSSEFVEWITEQKDREFALLEILDKSNNTWEKFCRKFKDIVTVTEFINIS